jgi:hypothetical protein
MRSLTENKVYGARAFDGTNSAANGQSGPALGLSIPSALLATADEVIE